jgi:phosphatidylglycerophosphatase C
MRAEESPAMPADDVVAVGPRTVLFDFDGVLSHGDAFYLFIRERYRRSLWRTPLAVLALPWLLVLLLARRRLPRRSLVHIALLGLGERGYRRAAEQFADHLARRPRQFLRDGLLALRRHQAAGDRVIVVTGCEQMLVTRLLAQLGLPEVEIVASQVRPGWFGMRLQQHNLGARKLRRLRALGLGSWDVAYSDSEHDVPMLRPAREAVLVNASPAQCKKVERALGHATTRVEWY